VRDLQKIRDESLRRRVREAIEHVEAAETLREASGFYRIRVGDYRIGIAVEGDEVEFVRCLHRRDIYRYFP
jgi:mRNA interferase RelE/StbE